MHLIDRSPGGFFALVGVVVYGVIGVEVWMCVADSVAVLAGTLTLIAITAGLICLFMVNLLSDGSDEPGSEPATTETSAARVPAVAVAPRRAARTGRPAHVA